MMSPVITSTDGLWVAQYEVDACGPRLLGDPGDQPFDLLADDHHHVGKFVDDYDDEGQTVEGRRRLAIRQILLGP